MELVFVLGWALNIDRLLGLYQVLDLPKSDLQITQGLKSRNKTVAVVGAWVDAGEEECLRRAREYLAKAVEEP